MKLAKTVVLAAFAAMPVQAADWRIIDLNDATETAAFYDRESLKAMGGVRQVWMLKVFAAENNGTRSTKTRLDGDCSKRTLKILNWVDYDDSGVVIASRSIKDAAQEVIPESVGENLLRAVCKTSDKSDRFQSPISTTKTYFEGKRQESEVPQ